ncbi:hypothetical protein Hypma_002060 [Hypsizygus marmoreus]|uniref:Uncharacterized protein n=1 Tax=Hypsizygus marmoreus TaxID=39966 RepID=A0A369JDT1_HYPMA|nr:hypothetical protein Hypma_002060 [Hypsizygus marmoreus]
MGAAVQTAGEGTKGKRTSPAQGPASGNSEDIGLGDNPLVANRGQHPADEDATATAAGAAEVKGNDPAPSGRRRKGFTFLRSYKAHALDDYVETIKQFGTTDSYSTECGELEHRTPKGRYRRTSKKAYKKQLAQIERHQARIRHIRQKLSMHAPPIPDNASPILSGNADEHHHIGITENNPQHIGTFLSDNSGDPAIQGFFHNLKDHLLPRLNALLRSDKDSGSADHAHPECDLDPSFLYFKKDTMFWHNVMRINYTTYDVRRAQDSINPNTDHCDIMLLADDSKPRSRGHHEYRYARVIGIYHVNLIYGGSIGGKVDAKPHRLYFLWVRWFEPVNDVRADRGWLASILDQLRFCRTCPGAFGFVDPGQILRACHVIPKFSSGKQYPDGIGRSKFAQDRKDWVLYYVNRFVDHDMLMRYHWGLGVGHLYTQWNGGLPMVDPQLPEAALQDEDDLADAAAGSEDGVCKHATLAPIDIIGDDAVEGAPMEKEAGYGTDDSIDFDNGNEDGVRDYGQLAFDDQIDAGDGDDGAELEFDSMYGGSRDIDSCSYD